MNKNMKINEENNDDIFLRNVKKIFSIIQKYPFQAVMVLLAFIAIIVMTSNWLGKRSSSIKTQDRVYQTLSTISYLNYNQENINEVITSIGNQINEMKSNQNNDSLVNSLVTLIDGYFYFLQMNYQQAAETWSPIASGQQYSSRLVQLIANLSFADIMDPYEATSILYPQIQNYFIEDSALGLLALLDAGENITLTILLDTIVNEDTTLDAFYELGLNALNYSYLNFNNTYFQNEIFVYRNILDAAYQTRKKRILFTEN